MFKLLSKQTYNLSSDKHLLRIIRDIARFTGFLSIWQHLGQVLGISAIYVKNRNVCSLPRPLAVISKVL